MSGILATSVIHSRCLWNRTEIRLEAGRAYSFSAQGRWVDWFVDCDADGYDSAWLPPVANLRRAPNSNWFKLMGSVDKRVDVIFPIGASSVATAPASGLLTCFANDLPWMYWNNRGQIELWVVPRD